jgi:hypothetical protein
MKTQIIVAAFVAVLGLSSFTGEKEKTSDASANITLSGIVVDSQTKETLAGVEVTIEGTKLKTYTDFEGNFSFDNIQPGNYKVVTKYVSYNAVESRIVSIQPNEMHALNLELHAQNSAPQVDLNNSLMATTTAENQSTLAIK